MPDKPPQVIVHGKNPGIAMTPIIELVTHDRAEYVIGCVLVFDKTNRYVLIHRRPEGTPNPGKDNKVVIKLARDRSSRKLRRDLKHADTRWKR